MSLYNLFLFLFHSNTISQVGPDWIRSIPPLETNKGLYTPELQVEIEMMDLTLYIFCILLDELDFPP